MTCAEWMRKVIFPDGPGGIGSEVNFIKTQAMKAGFTKSEVRRAKKELGLKTWHQKDESGENWFWRM